MIDDRARRRAAQDDPGAQDGRVVVAVDHVVVDTGARVADDDAVRSGGRR